MLFSPPGSLPVIVSVPNVPADPVDLLDRTEWLNRTEQVFHSLSERKASCTFALTAPWGTGKTFALNLLEKRLLNYKGGTQYFVFQYNCWKYDYYEEPLMAIVAAFLDYYDQATHVFDKTVRDSCKKKLAFAKTLITELLYGWAKTKTNVDLDHLLELYDKAKDAESNKALEQEAQRSFDVHHAFRKAISIAREAVTDLSELGTVVVFVDELDRCLPEYAIRVLERLHHLFFGVKNTLVLLSIDDDQLTHTIKQIFGEKTEVGDYLKKFIQFKIPLPTGRPSAGEGVFREKFRDYFDLFDPDTLVFPRSSEEFFSALFADIDIRTQEQIVERVKTVHTLAFPSEEGENKPDCSVLCFELLWTVLKYKWKVPMDRSPIRYDPNAGAIHRCVLLKGDIDIPVLSEYLTTNWSDLGITAGRSGSLTTYNLPREPQIPHLLLYYFHRLLQDGSKDYVLHPDTPNKTLHQQAAKNLRTFTSLMDAIL